MYTDPNIQSMCDSGKDCSDYSYSCIVYVAMS